MTDARTLIGRLGVQAPSSTRPVAEIRPFVARTAALGYSALWVGDGAARDPFAMLAAVAEAAGEMVLGTNIVNVYGRDVMATKMGAMTLHELTGGRMRPWPRRVPRASRRGPPWSSLRTARDEDA